MTSPTTPPTQAYDLADAEALLILEDGRCFAGRPYGASGQGLGEIVFATGMTGYQETLTDPSYHRQILVQTAPHIGNTGVNDEDGESDRIWVAGYVVRDPTARASSWRSRGELAEELRNQGIVGVCDVDTRAITRHLRTAGVMRAGIFSGPGLPRRSDGSADIDRALAIVRDSPPMAGQDLAGQVTTSEPYLIEPAGPVLATVAAVDLGIKAMTPQRLAERGLRVHVLPRDTSFDQIVALGADGVFFSNGPGDPAAAAGEIDLLRQVLDARIPFFGICYGNQLLGRALGFGTYKLGFGHRGINQPVMDRATGKVEITAHNHGFAVDAPLEGQPISPYQNGRYGRVRVSHIALNDNVVEGLECLDIPAFSVQYHPEAAAGPHDAAYLFDRFVDLITGGRQTSS